MSREDLPGLYVHVPFCRSKCPYCDFYSETRLLAIPSWLSALDREMTLYREQFPLFNTLYIGGGTPTVLEDDVLRVLFEGINRNFRFTENVEITVEVNPADITAPKFQMLASCRVNRISLGVQSFDDRDLRFLERRHTAKLAEEALGMARESGFEKVGIDLIYGIPGQSLAEWLETLERAVSFSPVHISCYQLTVSGKTRFGELLRKGTFKPPGETEGEIFFDHTARYLESRGYSHYEISNFARGEKNFSRHNQKYWQHLPYLGLGPSAHSFQGGMRWWNHGSIAEYCRQLGTGRKPPGGREELSREQLELESLFLGLRTRRGVELSCFAGDDTLKHRLSQLLSAGYLDLDGQRVVPTRKGFLVADRLPLAFVQE